MTATREGMDSEVGEALPERTLLQEEVEEARADLTQLHREVVEAEERLVNTHAAQLREANQELVVSTVRAQTHAEASAEQLKGVARASQHDALTGLPNRAMLLDRFAYAIANAKRHGAPLALLFLDLNGFKEINDTLGHAVGDEALKKAAECLIASVRDVDMVSRHGGDEFVILLAEVSQASDALQVAEKVIAALGCPHLLGTHTVPLSASIGISIYPQDGEDPKTLIDRADAAMYLAKKHEFGSAIFHNQGPTRERVPQAAPLDPSPPAVAPEALAPKGGVAPGGRAGS
ncbi:MAG TPA: GGDEF domain-containing protein [Vicinamibacteria bacterium]